MCYKYDVFLSYSSHDSEWVERLRTALEQANVRVWLDRDRIIPGDPIVGAIERGLQESKTVVIVVSAEAMASGWVREEYARAVALTIRHSGSRRIIPVLLRGAELPGFLESRRWVDFRESNAFETSLKTLLWGITVDWTDIDPATANEDSKSLEDIMLEAHRSLIVSGHTLDKFSESIAVKKALVTLFEKRVPVTLIFLNPYSSYARAHEPFHRLESRASARDQILKTIAYVHDTFMAHNPPGFTVLLSAYMPRFRTVIVDERVCYLNLYMYGEDVSHTPELMLDRNRAGVSAVWYKTISDSLHALMDSGDVLPLIRDGKFNYNWESSEIQARLRNCLETECCKPQARCRDRIRRVVLGFQNEETREAVQMGICDHTYKPGTFTLDKMSRTCTFLDTPMDFDAWLDEVLIEDLHTIREHYPALFGRLSPEEVSLSIKAALELRPKGQPRLVDEIWFQEYSDIFRRLVTIFLCGNPDFDLNTYPNLTHKRKAFMYRVLKRIEQEMTPSVKDWLHLSIAAGLLGIDEKPVHAATSAIDRSRGIAFDRPDEPEGLAVRRVAEELWDTARTKCRIDAAEAFLLRISCSHRDRISILSFPDDYLETIVLFRYYQELLRKYGGLRIDCVPRSLRCSNDVTYDDAIEFCSDFVELQSSPRFAVHDNGPKIGGVNLMKLHPKILRLIEAATFIDVRGARNFEMMQKINKETYFGFMVCREISEAVTGLRAEERPLVYVRQNPGDSSFDGFEYRHRRKDNRKMFALLTVADRKRQWEGGHLSEYHSWSKVRQERYSILQRFYSGNADVFHDKYGQALESEVREFLGALGGDILVIGCGSGKEVAWLWENGRSVLGIDFSSEAIQLAQREHPEISSQFRMEDFYNLDMVTDHQFNGIVANAAMVHLLERSDLSVMLDKIWAKLTDEGLCFLRMIEKEGFQQEMDRSQREGDRWFVYYTLDELQEACEGHGFVIERHDRRAHTRFAGVHWISLLLRKPSPTNRMDVSSQ